MVRFFRYLVLTALSISCLFESAQAQTNAAAETLFEIAKSYHDGISVEQDLFRARTLYKEAADQGSTDAMVNLGYLYFVGEGISKDYKIAREWYQKAANLGDISAQTNLKYMNENKLGLTNTNRVQMSMPIHVETPKSRTVLYKAQTKTNLPKVAAIERRETTALKTTIRRYNNIEPKASANTPTPKASENKSYSATNVFAAIILLAVLITGALIATLDRYFESRKKSSDALARAFFENNRRVLREIYLRYPHAMRDCQNRESPLSVAISVLMVRFSIFEKCHPSQTFSSKAKKRQGEILKVLQRSPAGARHLAFQSLPTLTDLIRSDIRAFDVEMTTQAERPLTPQPIIQSVKPKRTGPTLSLVS